MTDLVTLARKVRVVPERVVEAQCDDLVLQLGWQVVRFSQPRNTMQTPGIPDRKYYHMARRLTLWFECKREGGRQSQAQRRFQLMAEACGERYVLGGVAELRQAVIELTISPLDR